MREGAGTVTRRVFFLLGLAGLARMPSQAHAAGNATDTGEGALVERFAGGPAVPSSLVLLEMPAVFNNGYSVPMTVSVESPMTEADHVKSVLILAPKNPIIPVAKFEFTPASGRAQVATRIRLAEPQNVIAVAEMSDGSLLMTRAFVKVETNGCN